MLISFARFGLRADFGFGLRCKRFLLNIHGMAFHNAIP